LFIKTNTPNVREGTLEGHKSVTFNGKRLRKDKKIESEKGFEQIKSKVSCVDYKF